MSDWLVTSDNWPDWKDDRRKIECELSDGRLVTGRLCANDYGFDGEEEFPIWTVELSDGGEDTFCDSLRHRLIDA